MTATINKSTLMGPDEVLYELDRLGIRHKVHNEAFVTSACAALDELPRLKQAIAAHADELRDLLDARRVVRCAQCREPIRAGMQHTRAYTEDGARLTFHPACYQARHEQNPHLPQPEILMDEPGYTVVVEDSGLCCFCMMQESQLPEAAPMMCPRCWRKQDAKKNREPKAA